MVRVVGTTISALLISLLYVLSAAAALSIQNGGQAPSSTVQPSPTASPTPSLSPSPSPSPTPTPAPDPVVKIEMNAGENIKVSWPDGREARAFFAVSEIKTASMPLQVTENLCNDVEPVSCQIQAAYKLSEFRLQWTVNPDATKIGKTVKLVFGANSKQRIYGQGVLSWTYKPVAPVAAGDIPPDEMVCPDYSWLPGGSATQAPASLTISDWVADRMSTNPETGIDENRTIGGAYDVSTKRAVDGGMLFDSIAHLTGSGLPVLYGDVVSWFIKNPGGVGECQITLKPDSTALRTQVMKEFSVFDKATFNRYIYGSDEFMSVSFPFLFFVKLVNNRAPMVDAKGAKVLDADGNEIEGYVETPTE